MSKKLATDEEVEAWGLRHAVGISSVSDMRAAFDDAATLHMVTTPTQAAQIEALTLVKQKAERLLAAVFAFNGCKTEGSDLLFGRECEELREAITALSNTGKK